MASRLKDFVWKWLDGPKPLSELKPGECRWPIEDDEMVVGGFLFCGEEVAEGSPYCRRHRVMAGGAVRQDR